MKIYTKQEWDERINPIIKNKNTSNFETACSYFRQICKEIGQEISNPEFKGGYDEMVNFYNHSSYKTDRGLQLAIAWAGCNDLCKHEAKKIGLTSQQWWYRCWYLIGMDIDINLDFIPTWQPTDYILVVTGCGNSDYNGEYKLLDPDATDTAKEWHHTTNNYRIVWIDDHWIFANKSDYMTYCYSNTVINPWDATWYSTHEGDLTEIKVTKKSDLMKVVFTLSGSSNNEVNGEFVQTTEAAGQTGKNASYTNGKVYVWYDSSLNCWFCTHALRVSSVGAVHVSNGTGDDPWSVADGWDGVTCSRDIIFSVTGFSKYAEGANGDYLKTANTVDKTGVYAVYTNGPYYFFTFIPLVGNDTIWYVSHTAANINNAVSRSLGSSLNPWEEPKYLTYYSQNVSWFKLDDLTFTMGENGGYSDQSQVCFAVTQTGGAVDFSGNYIETQI